MYILVNIEKQRGMKQTALKMTKVPAKRANFRKEASENFLRLLSHCFYFFGNLLDHVPWQVPDFPMHVPLSLHHSINLQPQFQWLFCFPWNPSTYLYVAKHAQSSGHWGSYRSMGEKCSGDTFNFFFLDAFGLCLYPCSLTSLSFLSN